MKALIKYRTLLLFLTPILIMACYPSKPRRAFESYQPPVAPDYSSLNSWAAHPSMLDSADVVPSIELQNNQDKALADVFFIHPTTYTGTIGQNQWNGPIDEDKLNEKTDALAIRNQATIFNECYRVFAPRYRQAHIKSYVTNHKDDAKHAFEIAYSDVKSAFEYYLETHNESRPILIAGHSQGSTHAIRLLQEFFDGTSLQKQLVGAYIPGMLVRQEDFKTLTSCETSSETGCICSWRTMQEEHYPKKVFPIFFDDNLIINPLNWSTTEENVNKVHNNGSVLLNFYSGIHPGLVNAQISRGYLWIEKPKFRGSTFILSPNYHRGDFNLYYMNVRENACERLSVFASKY